MVKSSHSMSCLGWFDLIRSLSAERAFDGKIASEKLKDAYFDVFLPPLAGSEDGKIHALLVPGFELKTYRESLLEVSKSFAIFAYVLER